MENEIFLKKIEGWVVSCSVSEYKNETRGYYKDSDVARVDSEGKGWYGSDCTVSPVEIYEDNEGNIYSLKSLGRFKDEENKYKQEMIDKIKEKLSEEEQKVLGLK